MRRLASLLFVLAAVSSCSNASRNTLTVFAASSLTTAFESIAPMFESAYPGTRVRLSFGGSTALARQIAAGAPADVFAAADSESLSVAGAAAGPPVIIAHTRLAIAVAPGNPKHVTGAADLARTGLIVVVCAPEVPCGRRTGEMLAKAGVTVRPSSTESSVRGALSKVTAGEADAAVVYDTDVRAAGSAVTGVAIDDAWNVTAAYPIVTLRRARDAALARKFTSFVAGDDARAVFRSLGFQAP